MRLEKINYGTAVFFGVATLFMYLIIGIMQWLGREQIALLFGQEVILIQALVMAPLIGGIVGYLITALMILIYNTVAKKYPISWEVKK